MSQISQQSDGTYTKSYSDTELGLIKELHAEQKARISSDNTLQQSISAVSADVTALKEQNVDVNAINDKLNINALDIEQNQQDIATLKKTTLVESYSKTEMDRYLPVWKLEEIAYVLTSSGELTNALFDNAKMKDIRIGYAHYPNANINDMNVTSLETGDKIYSETNSIRPNTVRRYTMSAYSGSNKQVTFRLRYGDRLVILAKNGSDENTFVFETASYDTERLAVVPLKPGWTKIQFLLANGTQGGGLFVQSDLATQAERLYAFDQISGKFTGDQIEPGTIDETHFNENMNLKMKQLHATVGYDPNTQAIIPAVIAGDTDSGGAVQVGDGVITKQKDEPYIFDGDIRIMGKLVDKDGTIIDENSFGSGLTTEERQKLDSVGYNAEENQNTFSYIEAAGVPYPKDALGNDIGPGHPKWDPQYNVIAAEMKTDTMRIMGANGIVFDIVKDAAGNPTLVVKAQPTTNKEEKFVSRLDQAEFVLTTGAYKPGTGTVHVYLEGQRLGADQFDESTDGKTIKLKQKLPAGKNVLISWTEGMPDFSTGGIIELADLPPATRTNTGLMTKDHVIYLYDHQHDGLPSPDEWDQAKKDISDMQNQIGGDGSGTSLADRVKAVEDVVGIGAGGSGKSLSEMVAQMEGDLAAALQGLNDSIGLIDTLAARVKTLEDQIQQALTYS